MIIRYAATGMNFASCIPNTATKKAIGEINNDSVDF